MSKTRLLPYFWGPIAVGMALSAVWSTASANAAPDAKSIQKERDSLQGTWLPHEARIGGQDIPAEVLKSLRLTLKGDRYEVSTGKASDKTSDSGVIMFDPSTTPHTMAIKGEAGPNKGKTLLAIYELAGDELKICYDLSGGKTPAEFASEPATQLLLVKYRRETR